MTAVIPFVFGAFVGSFLNVVATRWGTRSFLSGRSSCPHCGKTLSWKELIPIVSFFMQKGKCISCSKPVSWQYPLVEVWTGLVFISIFSLPTNVPRLLFLIVFCIYIVIAVYDFHHKIIPDKLVYSAILFAFLGRLLSDNYTLDWLAGPILFGFFAAVWHFSKGRAMGFGDAKLGLSVGFLLGAAQGFSAIVLAFWLGALASIFLIGSKKFTIKSEVPFAPFIILGAWIASTFSLDLLYVTALF